MIGGNTTSLGKASTKASSSVESAAKGWIKDFVEVGVTVLVLIVVLRAAFGSETLVPLVVVTSGSMLHLDGGWSSWLSENWGDSSLVSSVPFQSGFAKGDMIFTVSPDKYHVFPDTRLGDVIIYDRDLGHLQKYASNEPIIHRIIGVLWVEDGKVVKVDGTTACLNEKNFERYIGFVDDCQRGLDSCLYPRYPEGGSYRFYVTKGDNNPSPDQCGVNGGIAYPVNEKQLKARGWIRLPYVGWIKLLFNYVLLFIFWFFRSVFSLLPL
ncbi:MAG: hypothetical protein ABH834_05735 [Candidatus Altiarchaeota archaeon]